MRLVGDYNFLRLFGQVGFAQGAEMFAALGEVGWTTSLRAMPRMNDVFTRLKSGDLKINDPLIKELESYGASVGIDKFMNSPTSRLDYEGDIPLEKGSGFLDNAEIISGQSKRFVADIGGLQPMTILSQVWGSKALTMRIVENVLDLSKQFKTTNIFKKFRLTTLY
jgi:hypothetical protein